MKLEIGEGRPLHLALNQGGSLNPEGQTTSKQIAENKANVIEC